MSHYKDLATGRYIMTEVNALRHFIRLSKIALNSDNIVNMKLVCKEATYHINIDKCFKCPYNDFGYCCFRGTRSIPEEQHFKLCFTNWIKAMEYELCSLLKRKGKMR